MPAFSARAGAGGAPTTLERTVFQGLREGRRSAAGPGRRAGTHDAEHGSLPAWSRVEGHL